MRAVVAIVLFARVALAEMPAVEPAPVSSPQNIQTKNESPAAPSDPPKEVETTERDFVEDDYQLRLSLPTQADLDAWGEAGIRVSLAYQYGHQYGRHTAPSYSTHGAMVRAWLRLDPQWSLGTTFSYEFDSVVLSGLKWGATVEPTFHVWRGLAVTAGLGYGGHLSFRHDLPPDGTPEPDFNVDVENRTLGNDEWLSSCEGGGWLGLARVEYQMVVGPLFSTGPFVQGNALWTQCQMSLGQNPETGRPTMRRQWWTTAGWNVGWWLTWR